MPFGRPPDPEELRSEAAVRLPVHRRWLIQGEPLDFDFSRAQAPLRTIGPEDVRGCEIEPEWRDLLLFGEEDSAEGGGASPFIGVHRQTGEIFGLDVERDDSQVFLLSSTFDAFVRTFFAIDGMLRGEVSRAELSQALMAIDPHAYPRSEWRELVEYLESQT